MSEIAGLKLIVPTSVSGTGVSVSASGKVSFSGSSSVSVNGVFTALYDNYLIVTRNRLASTTQTLSIRMRSAGTDETGSNYTRQNVTIVNTAVDAVRQTFTTGYFGNSSADHSGHHVYIYGPFLTQPTVWRGLDAQATVGWSENAVVHTVSSSYDGFTLNTDASTLTGALCVYGLSQ